MPRRDPAAGMSIADLHRDAAELRATAEWLSPKDAALYRDIADKWERKAKAMERKADAMERKKDA